MLLPGPEAQQLATYIGWLMHRTLGGLIAGGLFMVLQFVGFMAAFRHPEPLSPLLAATLGGLLATWVTFTPCFLWKRWASLYEFPALGTGNFFIANRESPHANSELGMSACWRGADIAAAQVRVRF
jgi:hypothetical protein